MVNAGCQAAPATSAIVVQQRGADHRVVLAADAIAGVSGAEVGEERGDRGQITQLSSPRSASVRVAACSMFDWCAARC